MILKLVFFSKPIPETVWVLIFTSLGKYFFFNCKTGERCWIPPESVIKTLKEKFSPSKREMFFDPFYQGEGEEEGEGEGEGEGDDDINGEEDDDINGEESDDDKDNVLNDDLKDFELKETPQNNQSVIYNKIKIQPKESSNVVDSLLEDDFKLYLLKHSVDPFSPWPTILSLHSSSPQFKAIPSDKRRQDLFAQICPVLIEQKREEGKKKVIEANKWWDEVKGEYLKLGWQWFQVIKKIKGNTKFSYLNEKECEKEYKNLLNKRR